VPAVAELVQVMFLRELRDAVGRVAVRIDADRDVNDVLGVAGSIVGIDISRVVDGKVAEHWAQFDGLGTMMQLGAIAAPA